MSFPKISAVIPAAGIGARMQADIPKQYLKIGNKTILEHTVEKLLEQAEVDQVIVAVSPIDELCNKLSFAANPKVKIVFGGKERADSVLAGLNAITTQGDYDSWVLVHDAARPLVKNEEISTLISNCLETNTGGILAAPVSDTMKRGISQAASEANKIESTVERKNLWHALTPQFFRADELSNALSLALDNQVAITDEASAIEWADGEVLLVEGSSDNIKITRPADLALAEFLITQAQNVTSKSVKSKQMENNS